MTCHRQASVSQGLAHYLGLGQNQLFPRLELHRDLGLEPLDLVLFVLDFEEAEAQAFPFEELQFATTVGDLIQLMTDWLEDCDRLNRLEAAEHEHFAEAAGA